MATSKELAASLVSLQDATCSQLSRHLQRLVVRSEIT